MAILIRIIWVCLYLGVIPSATVFLFFLLFFSVARDPSGIWLFVGGTYGWAALAQMIFRYRRRKLQEIPVIVLMGLVVGAICAVGASTLFLHPSWSFTIKEIAVLIWGFYLLGGAPIILAVALLMQARNNMRTNPNSLLDAHTSCGSARR